MHEIKLDGFRMAPRIEHDPARLLTRTGVGWSLKYPGMVAALAAIRAKSAYLDGELCGVGEDGLRSAETQATDGARGAWSFTPLTSCISTAVMQQACCITARSKPRPPGAPPAGPYSSDEPNGDHAFTAPAVRPATI